MREKLINSILELSGDELEKREDIIAIAKETEEQLIDRLIHIASWYADEYNSN